MTDLDRGYTMKKIALVIIFLAALIGVAHAELAAAGGVFETIDTRNLAKDKFVFPDDIRGGRVNVVFLAMSADKDNGTYQQRALLDWQSALDERGVFSNDVRAFHFPVLPKPPFFIKGLIVRANRKAYEGKVSLDRSAVLYVDDLDAFAAAAKLPLDGEPIIVITAADATPLHYLQGQVSDAGLAEISAAIDGVLAE